MVGKRSSRWISRDAQKRFCESRADFVLPSTGVGPPLPPYDEDETDGYKGELTRVSIVPPGFLNSTTYPRSTPSRMCKQRQISFGTF